MSYIAPGTSPAKVWSYATRTLANHKRFLFISTAGSIDVIGGLYKSESAQSQSIGAGASASYSWTENIPLTGKIRIRVKAYIPNIVSSSPYDIALSIDGTQVASATSVTITGSYKVFIDYIGDITAGSHTFTVTITNNTAGSITVYCYIVIANGIELSSTTNTTLLTANAPSYTLEVNGNFKYEIGIRYKIIYSPKTTTAFTITVNGDTPQNADLSAGNVDQRTGYGTCAYNDTITLAGVVGTTGDVVIITNLYIIVALRQNQLVNGMYYSLVVEEEGVALAQAFIYVFDGVSTQAMIHALAGDEKFGLWASATNTASWTWAGIWRAVANNSLLGIRTSTGDDSQSQSAIPYLLVVII